MGFVHCILEDLSQSYIKCFINFFLFLSHSFSYEKIIQFLYFTTINKLKWTSKSPGKHSQNCQRNYDDKNPNNNWFQTLDLI